MVPASPISGIMCDHYPVPLITTRTWECVWANHRDRGKEVFCAKEYVCVCVCDASKRENKERKVCVHVWCVCVHAGSWLSLPQHPPCHFQLQRASGLCYSSTQLTRPHLFDTKRQSAINTLINAETWPTVLNVILRSYSENFMQGFRTTSVFHSNRVFVFL